jgi:hypothetical protein
LSDDLVLLDKEERILQGMTDRPTEIGRCYGMEMNVEKIKEMRISRQQFQVQIMLYQKQLEIVEHFN